MHLTAPIGIVIATRDRRDALLATLARLAELEPQPPVVVVDNGSRDGTPQAVASAFPDVRLLALGRNRGAAARNEGVRRLTTRYVALLDDDQQALAIMLFIDGMTQSEAAAELGVSRVTVNKRTQKLRSQLGLPHEEMPS